MSGSDRGDAGVALDPAPAPGAAPGRSAPEPAEIEVRGLVRRFGERLALSGIDFSLERDRTLAVLGPNGAGKTTLLRVLATLLRPHAGDVRVAGAALPAEAWKVRGRIGYLGHDPLLYRELTARENLRFHADLHGVGGERVDELLVALRLEHRADEPVRDLSRGTVQRVAAARAVLHDPPLLLLDEPRAGLDPAAAELLQPLLGRDSGRTRVLVTHDVASGLAECDVAVGLRAGRQELAGAAGELDPDRLRELYA